MTTSRPFGRWVTARAAAGEMVNAEIAVAEMMGVTQTAVAGMMAGMAIVAADEMEMCRQ